MSKISTCLWFDSEAEEAAAFYVSLFPNSRILDTKYYLEGSPRPAGSVLAVQFTLDGTEYVALNGGPTFKFSPAVSLVAYCDTQEEVDTLWRKLSEGGHAGQCGWVTDKYGLSWQIVPRVLLSRWYDRQATRGPSRAIAGTRRVRRFPASKSPSNTLI